MLSLGNEDATAFASIGLRTAAVSIMKKRVVSSDGPAGGLNEVFGFTGPEIIRRNNPSSGNVNGTIVATTRFTVNSALNVQKPTSYLNQLSSLNVMSGNLELLSNAAVSIETNLLLNGGALSVTKGQRLNIARTLVRAATFLLMLMPEISPKVIDGNVPLSVNLGTIPFNVSQIVVPVANFSRMIGNFGSIQITPAPGRKRSVIVTENGITCTSTLQNPTLSSSFSSSLSVVVSVSNVCTPSNVVQTNVVPTNPVVTGTGTGPAPTTPAQQQQQSNELSTGAIVGIAVGE